MFLGVVGGYFYQTQFGTAYVVEAAPDVGGDLRTFRSIKIDFSILERPEYKNLQIFGESPVTPGQSGKINPFGN